MFNAVAGIRISRAQWRLYRDYKLKKLYSYVVMHDTGFAPNPFFGYCTLACCNPKIRQTAEKGEWVVGLTSRASGNRIVYFMRVDDVLESFGKYWTDSRFRTKKPGNTGGLRTKCGDNIYQPLPSGGYPLISSSRSSTAPSPGSDSRQRGQRSFC